MKKKDCLLSVAMIVKDEEHNIRRALESIKDVVDEIVVVDTGSKDRTPEIVKEYTNKLYFHEWRDDFSEARNYSLKFPTCEWVMILDADEEASEDFRKNIRNYLENLPDDINTVYLPTISYLDWDFERKEIASTPRIFKNGTVFYKNIVHNQAIYKPKVVHAPFVIYHYGYIWTRKLKKKKYERSRNLIVKHLKHVKTPMERLYYLIQLYKIESTGGYLYRKYDAAWEAFRMLEKMNKAPVIALEFMFLFGMDCLASGLYEIAEKLFKTAISSINDNPDPYYGMMALNDLKENWDEVIKWGEKFLDVLNKSAEKMEEYTWTIMGFKYVARADVAIGRAYFRKGEYEKGTFYFEKALKDFKESGEDFKFVFNVFANEFIRIKSKKVIEHLQEITIKMIKTALNENVKVDFFRVLEHSLEYGLKFSDKILNQISPSNAFERCVITKLKGDEHECMDKIVLENINRVDFVRKYGVGALLFLYEIYDEMERTKFLSEVRKEVDEKVVKSTAFALIADKFLKEGRFKESLNLYRKSIELHPEFSHIIKPVIEDLKTSLSTDIEGVYEELLRKILKGNEMVFDLLSYLGKDLSKKLYIISNHPYAIYTSAISQDSFERARELLKKIKNPEKFPFYHYRLAKTYEKENPKKAFELHIKACEENEKLGDISLGRYIYTALYPNATYSFMKSDDEMVFASNISERFSTCGIISPVRAWKLSKKGFLYAFPYPTDEALKIYKEREKEIYKERPFKIKKEIILNALFEVKWMNETVNILTDNDDIEYYESVANELNLDIKDNAQRLIIIDGIEENHNLSAILSRSIEIIAFFQTYDINNKSDFVFYYPGFRILRTTFQMKKELEDLGYEVLNLKAFGPNLRMIHAKKIKS